MNNPISEKILVLGVDGFEPKLAKKFMDQGKMPNLQKYVDAGSCRDDLVLLGAVPTVTPPLWTTLATGSYPATHGITAFYNQHPEKYGTKIYALDSRMCKAEPLWNVFAEAGKKTLVWHWPGSSWPPTSDSANLHVVDGTQPAAINMGTAVVDWESIGLASEDIEAVRFQAHDAPNNTGAGCIITDLDDVADETGRSTGVKGVLGNSRESFSLTIDEKDTEVEVLGNINFNNINSPIKPASGWANAPEDAKEFIILTSNGFVRRPALILKNEDGIYDTIAIYTSKKAAEPLVVLKKDEYVANVIDEVIASDHPHTANRHMRLLEIAEDGSRVKYWMSNAYDITSNKVWHPASLLKDITQNIGAVPPVSLATARIPEYADKLIMPAWDFYCDWQAKSLHYLMDRYDVIFSHLHNVDAIGHQVWHLAHHHERWNNDEVFYQNIIEKVYIQTDRYLGEFLDRLEEGWTIVITSDHGLISEVDVPCGLGEGGVNATVMKDLGYTVLKKDENGKELRELDLTKTKAIANRGCYIYLNLKGRYPHGIVDPADQYELERQIITDLYNYKDPVTGKRVVSIALRNKDAVALGLGGPECGDIVYFMEEGHTIIHMDSLATFEGYFDTSVSPIFVAAGKGIKKGYKTDRTIRQVDVAPTLAVLGGVRCTAQNEGSVIHQIIEN